MRGSIINRNGHYSVVLSSKDSETGKWKRQWIGVKGNYRDAERKLSELVNQVNTGSFVKPGKLTVREHIM
jgi:hypothetical protein